MEQTNQLTSEQKEVLLNKGTEAPFSGEYVDYKGDGMFHCAQCGNVLFAGGNKFESGTGWPSFDQAAADGSVELRSDDSHSMHRTEVVCKKCGGHLGHVFDDGPKDTTCQRFCINSAALKLDADKK